MEDTANAIFFVNNLSEIIYKFLFVLLLLPAFALYMQNNKKEGTDVFAYQYHSSHTTPTKFYQLN